jgi:hypothetical protein
VISEVIGIETQALSRREGLSGRRRRLPKVRKQLARRRKRAEERQQLAEGVSQFPGKLWRSWEGASAATVAGILMAESNTQKKCVSAPTIRSAKWKKDKNGNEVCESKTSSAIDSLFGRPALDPGIAALTPRYSLTPSNFARSCRVVMYSTRKSPQQTRCRPSRASSPLNLFQRPNNQIWGKSGKKKKGQLLTGYIR